MPGDDECPTSRESPSARCLPELLASKSPAEPPSRVRLGLLLLGWLLPQFLVYGKALCGITTAMPLDILARPHFYLPHTAEYAQVQVDNPLLSDLVLSFPFAREFAVRRDSQRAAAALGSQ